MIFLAVLCHLFASGLIQERTTFVNQSAVMHELSSHIVWKVDRNEIHEESHLINYVIVDLSGVTGLNNVLDIAEQSLEIQLAHIDALSDMPWPSAFVDDRHNIIVIKNYFEFLGKSPEDYLLFHNAILNSIYYYNLHSQYSSHVVLLGQR